MQSPSAALPLVLTGFAEVVTNDPARPGLLGKLADGVVVIEGERVAWVGPRSELPPRFQGVSQVEFPGAAALPGFVDSHTHAVFAGDRAAEFGMRAGGATYEEILAAGGGIHSTVAATTAADRDSVTAQTRARLERMLAAGTTTVEVKSGYGLSVETEVRLLEIVRDLASELAIEIVPTFLGAHAIPPGMHRSDYLRLVIDEMLPAVASLAEGCDVFCDTGVFTVDEASRVLEAGRRYGLLPRVHACQLANIGAARLAAELHAASADHLDHVCTEDMALLRESGVVAVLLPGVSFSLRLRPPPARDLWDTGVTVALATDCNPGTSYVMTMPWVVAVAVREMGLTPEEAVWAATRGGALALRRPNHGLLAPGSVADIVILDAGSYLHLAYRPDSRLVQAVFKRGARVV